jgi:hypothetical protein
MDLINGPMVNCLMDLAFDLMDWVLGLVDYVNGSMN